MGTAFRTALETRLRAEASCSGLPLTRLRKTVAFDRLLARMISAQPEAWVLKGGFALQLRLQRDARTTKDVDFLLLEMGRDSHALLVEAARVDLGDWFAFEVAVPVSAPAHGGVRMPVRCRLDGREFETFHVDVGVGDQVRGASDLFTVTTLLDFADISPTLMPCYPLAQHVAEKLHALTRPHGERENSRVKDLVDLVLIAETTEIASSALKAAVQATFDDCGTHVLPAMLGEVPATWRIEYRRMAREVAAGLTEVDDALSLVRAFLEPVFTDDVIGSWQPAERVWSDTTLAHPK